MNNDQSVERTIEYVRRELSDAEGGHDWWHIQRVWQNAIYISKKEQKGDLIVIELAALLHDIADAKFHNGDETIAPIKARAFMEGLNIQEDIITHVINIIDNMSFRKRNENKSFNSIELQIVQDADRLEAIGAIGIARVFNYGGFMNRPIYVPPLDNITELDSQHTIGHFYDKLLLLKNMMNTETGKELAEDRHAFMELYLKQFYKELSIDNLKYNYNGLPR